MITLEKTLDTPGKTSKSVETASVFEYVSFWARLAAALIDGILVGLVASIFTGTFGLGGEGLSTNSVGAFPVLISWVYYVFMTVNYGATLGKMALKIKVEHMETGEKLSYGEAILREVVGKFVSSAILGLGYFWMLWDDKKQTWHDKIGKSFVVKA